MTTPPPPPPAEPTAAPAQIPDADAILAALDPQQAEVAATPVGPMRVLAGAGTGKTRAITHRIAYGVRTGQMAPQQVLAVTFTARAAGEMRTRLRELGVSGVQARTFHAAALRQLHYFWPMAIGGPSPQVMPSKAGAVAEAAKRLGLGLDRTGLRDVAAEIEWSKVSLLTSDSYPEHIRRTGRELPQLDATAMARLIAAYEAVKSERGVIDFEDVLLLTSGILNDRPDIAETVRRTYRHFLVDEYQDVNALQQRLLTQWLGEGQNLCVVGDPAQTIYSFTGATSSHLLNFTKVFPQARTVELVRNYRSSPQIISLANRLMQGPSGMRRGVTLEATREAGIAAQVCDFTDDEAEADGIAAAIEQVVQRRPPSQIAVLFRTNGQSEAVEAALARRDIPYLVRGGERFFSRREVKEGVLLLRGAARSDDGSVPLEQLTRDVLGAVGLTTQPPSAGGAARERWESLTALVSVAATLARTDPQARMPALIAELDERARAQHAPQVEGVTLASLHAAKGLEWPVVFLIGCSEGLMPIAMAEGAEAINEERRLLYVGITRARDELSISWARSRQPGGRSNRAPSRFLVEAGVVTDPRSQPGGSGSGRGARRSRASKGARAATCRVCGQSLAGADRSLGRCQGCPSSYDESLLLALKAWRSAVAKEASVPAFVVCKDVTLVELAEKLPSSATELAAISGLGPAKIDRYGAGILQLLGEHERAKK